jgi:dCMP deaminase
MFMSAMDAIIDEEIAKDKNQLKWDKRFLELAKLVASWSKDRSTKVGAVIVGPFNDVRSLGYNGFPRGIDDEVEERHARPAKYKWTEHAERNALYNALLTSTSVERATMYLTWYPCADCARAILQSGIARLVCARRPDDSNPAFIDDFKVTQAMFSERGLSVTFIED